MRCSLYMRPQLRELGRALGMKAGKTRPCLACAAFATYYTFYWPLNVALNGVRPSHPRGCASNPQDVWNTDRRTGRELTTPAMAPRGRCFRPHLTRPEPSVGCC